jgi:hypothetical protein
MTTERWKDYSPVIIRPREVIRPREPAMTLCTMCGGSGWRVLPPPQLPAGWFVCSQTWVLCDCR